MVLGLGLSLAVIQNLAGNVGGGYEFQNGDNVTFQNGDNFEFN